MSNIALWNRVETARAGQKSRMMYEAPQSRYGRAHIQIEAQTDIPHNGYTVEVSLPTAFVFDGRKLSKDFGDGPADLGLPEIAIFWEELPDHVIKYILELGISRYITTSYAGSKSPGEVVSSVTRRLYQLFSGDVGVRANASPQAKAASNPDYKIISRLFAAQLLSQTEKAFGGKKPLGKDKEGSKKWDQAQVDALKLLAAHPKVVAMVAEEKARLAAAEEAAKGLFADDVDLLGGIGELRGEGAEDDDGESDDGVEDDEEVTAPENHHRRLND